MTGRVDILWRIWRKLQKSKSQAPPKNNFWMFLEIFTKKLCFFSVLWLHFYFFCPFLKNASEYIEILSFMTFYVQPVSYKLYFRCNNCFLLLVYTIHLSLSTNLVDPPPTRTIYMKHPLAQTPPRWCSRGSPVGWIYIGFLLQNL